MRELKHVVRRLVALCPTPRITRADLPPDLVRAAEAGGPAREPVGEPAGGLLPTAARTADDAERVGLVAVRAARTMGEAALHLGITRGTLYRRLARYGMRTERTLRGR